MLTHSTISLYNNKKCKGDAVMEKDCNKTNTDNEVTTDANSPIAQVTLQFAPMEIEHVLNNHAKPVLKRLKRLLLLCALLFAASGVLLFVQDSELTALCVFIVIFILLYYFKAAKNTKKAAHKNAQESEYTKDTYEIFDDYCRICITQKDKLKTVYYMDYKEIDSLVEDEHYFSFVRKNLIYTLRKNDPVCQLLIDKIKADAACDAEKEAKKEIKKQAVSIAMIAVLFITAMLPMILRNWLSYDFFSAIPMQPEYFLMLLPAAAIIFSIIFRKKLKAGAVCSLAILTILILSLLAWVNSPDPADAFYDADQAALAASLLQQAEDVIEFELPDDFETLYAYETEGENCCHAAVNIAEGAIEEFTKTLQSSDKWLDYQPSILTGLSPFYGEADFMLLYNEDTKLFNVLPDQSGTYSFLYLNFDTEDGFLYAERYEADYVAYEQ